MSEPILVPPEDVDDLRTSVQGSIRAVELADSFREIDPGPYGLTSTSLELLEALETGGACLVAACRALTGRIAADRRAGFAAGDLTAVEQRFCSLAAAYVGTQEALARCGAATDGLPPRERHLRLDEYRQLLSAPEETLLPALLEDLASFLRFYRSKDSGGARLEGPAQLRACVASYLSLVGATAMRLGDDGEYAAILDAWREAGLSINGTEYRGFERQTALPEKEESELMEIWPDDIIGNADVLEAGLNLARAVAGFDLEKGRNPRMIRNPVLFVLGAPGCGKTVTAHAIGNYFLDLCSRNRIPARFRIIRRTDWASHFQNKSANELLRIFRQEIFDYPGVAGAYWPDIDTAFAARDDPGIRAEEKAVLGTLFGLLDGTVGPRNGKWFLIADANYLTMDQAALSRLTQDPHYAKGPQSPEDFVEMLRDKKLHVVSEKLLIDEAQWQAFGQRCVDCGLSGRAVDNIAGKILTDMEAVELPDTYFSMSFDEKTNLLRERRRSLDFAALDALVDRYIRFEKEAEEKAQHERFQRRVKEIREQLAARVAAVGGGPE